MAARTWGAVVVAASLLVARGEARAAGDDAVAPAYTYEIDNASARPAWVLVLWPRDCTSAGEPLGTVDLALNPAWASRAHDVDYEVLAQGRRYELPEACAGRSRIYALPAATFPRSSRPSTADDVSIGQKEAGASLAILPALDAIDRKQRIAFFASDPRVLRSSFQLQVPRAARPDGSPPAAPLAAVNDVLMVDDFDAAKGTFSVVPKHAVYTYSRSDVTETVDYDAGGPVPGGPAALPPGPPAAPASPDGGTRWVFVAAIAGMLVGGLIAYRRKNPKK